MEERRQELLEAALYCHVSDIHFSYYTRQEKVEMAMRFPEGMRRLKPKEGDTAFFHYLMYRANLDLSDMSQPQTGRFEEELDGKRISLRFACMSSYGMVSGVLRLLNNHADLKVSDLSDDPDTVKWLQKVTSYHEGLVVFTGPTGSGKTTTLYTLLNETQNKTIYTLEDPIEVYSDHYVQLQVSAERNLSYAQGIRQLMRHDPDIIMIGEIRDEEAAEGAVRAALTGHLVVSTLHSIDCTGAILRLEDLGIRRSDLQEVLRGISSQRLITEKEGGRKGIYEIMDEKELACWFGNGHCSENFVPLAKKMEAAEKNFSE